MGLTLSGKSTLLANDKSLGKLIVGHPGMKVCPSVWRHQPLAWVSKPQRVSGDVQQTNGNAYGKADEGPRELTVYAR